MNVLAVWKRENHVRMYTKHSPAEGNRLLPPVHGPPQWTYSIDPFVDPVHGLPLWTIPLVNE